MILCIQMKETSYNIKGTSDIRMLDVTKIIFCVSPKSVDAELGAFLF